MLWRQRHVRLPARRLMSLLVCEQNDENGCSVRGADGWRKTKCSDARETVLPVYLLCEYPQTCARAVASSPTSSINQRNVAGIPRSRSRFSYFCEIISWNSFICIRQLFVIKGCAPVISTGGPQSGPKWRNLFKTDSSTPLRGVYPFEFLRAGSERSRTGSKWLKQAHLLSTVRAIIYSNNANK